MKFSFARFLVLGSLALPACASLITIQNGNFEATVALPNCIGSSCFNSGPGAIPNFTASVPNNTGILAPGSNFYNVPIPDPTQIAYNNGGLISQTLGSTFAANTTYTFSALIGQRKDVSLAGYSLQLLNGSTPLIGVTVAAPVPGPGNFAQATYTFDTALNPGAVGQPITVGLFATSNQGQVAFDALSLNSAGNLPSPVPEPATLMFMGSGLVGIALLRRRSNARKSL